MAVEITEEFVWQNIPRRPRDSHKGTFGSVLAVAGSAFYRALHCWPQRRIAHRGGHRDPCQRGTVVSAAAARCRSAACAPAGRG